METRTEDRPMRPFLVLISGQAFSLLGSQAVQFAMIWWLTMATGSATVLAAATLLGLLPQIVLGPFIGALVDRWNRKRILWLADSVVAVASAFLALSFAAGPVPYPLVLVVLFVRALGEAFHAPAMLASTTLMVPERRLTRVQGLRTVERYQKALAEGRLPHQEVLDGLLILVAGAILLTPGFLTDACGFLLLVPAFRTGIRNWLGGYLETRIQVIGPDGALNSEAPIESGGSSERIAKGRVIEEEK